MAETPKAPFLCSIVIPVYFNEETVKATTYELKRDVFDVRHDCQFEIR